MNTLSFNSRKSENETKCVCLATYDKGKQSHLSHVSPSSYDACQRTVSYILATHSIQKN